ncbi:MAG TPA: M1 family metallopeptidase [Pyrinomonadaceae bacterium]|nr:M1 family metallopeptidase [Pyrinomonadaceae bacterium]
MKLQVKPLSLVFIVLLSASSAVAIRVERLIDKWKPEHYLVNITLNDQLSEIASATARINIQVLKRTTVIDLDFGDLTTQSVFVNSRPATFTHKAGKLHVNLAEPANPGTRLVITITYHGKPKDGLILTKDKDGKPSAVGDNWPDRLHHWIPTLDHPSAKATITFNITAPAREEVVANGRLDHVETTAGGTRTWTYSEGAPIPPYCMIIAVGQFARIEPTGRSLTPLSYYVPHSERHLAEKGLSPTAPALEFFSQLVATYPYEKLAMIVGATRYGGMENSSAIVFTGNLFNRPATDVISKTYGISSANVRLIAHEIAHQWFGDSVTESTWADLWLSEGFATYFAGLFVQRYESEEAFQKYMSDAARNIFEYEKRKRTPIFDRDTESLLDLLNANNYQKGAWVLHMLRSSLGDGVFFRGIRSYYEAHKNSTATTEDLRSALEKASGRNLRAFFTRWIYEAGHPQYELSWRYVRPRQLRLILKQLQPGKAFQDPVPITVSTASGSQTITLNPTTKQLIKTISLPSKPTQIVLDPKDVLLNESTIRAL